MYPRNNAFCRRLIFYFSVGHFVLFPMVFRSPPFTLSLSPLVVISRFFSHPLFAVLISIRDNGSYHILYYWRWFADLICFVGVSACVISLTFPIHFVECSIVKYLSRIASKQPSPKVNENQIEFLCSYTPQTKSYRISFSSKLIIWRTTPKPQRKMKMSVMVLDCNLSM